MGSYEEMKSGISMMSVDAKHSSKARLLGIWRSCYVSTLSPLRRPRGRVLA
jgi:hypothetical protein